MILKPKNLNKPSPVVEQILQQNTDIIGRLAVTTLLVIAFVLILCGLASGADFDTKGISSNVDFGSNFNPNDLISKTLEGIRKSDGIKKLMTGIYASVIALAFLTACGRFFKEIWVGGTEAIGKALKKEAMAFFIVCCICTAISAFSASAINLGLKIGGDVAGGSWTTVASDSVNKVNESANQRLKQMLGSISGAGNEMYKEFSKGMTQINGIGHLSELFVFIAFFLVLTLACFMIIIWFIWASPMMYVWVIITLCINLILALKLAYPAWSAAASLFDLLVGGTMGALVQCVADMLFTLGLTFLFFKNALSIVAHSILWQISLPLSAYNLSFESRKHVFWDNAIRGLNLALSFVFLVVCTKVATELYINISGSGMMKDMIKAFIVLPDFRGALDGGNIVFLLVQYILWYAKVVLSMVLMPLVFLGGITKVISHHSLVASWITGVQSGIGPEVNSSGGMINTVAMITAKSKTGGVA